MNKPTELTIVDAHQHFWSPKRFTYAWMDPEDATLYRDCLPLDYRPLRTAHGIQSSVVVQAAPLFEESLFLADMAAADDHIAGVVAWIDFDQPDLAASQIEQLRLLPKV